MSAASEFGAIDLWKVQTGGGARLDGDAALGMLSAAEQDRASRFVAIAARARFVIGRAALRIVLAAYVGGEPSRLLFDEAAAGKLELRAGQCRRLHFNVSHADGLAVIAVTSSGPVGVDIERVREILDASAIADRFFAARERKDIDTTPALCRSCTFLRLWTRKEAVLKAEGIGLRALGPVLDVSFERSAVSIPGSEAAAIWYLRDISPADCYLGAYAVTRPNLRERWLELPYPSVAALAVARRATARLDKLS